MQGAFPLERGLAQWMKQALLNGRCTVALCASSRALASGALLSLPGVPAGVMLAALDGGRLFGLDMAVCDRLDHDEVILHTCSRDEYHEA